MDIEKERLRSSTATLEKERPQKPLKGPKNDKKKIWQRTYTAYSWINVVDPIMENTGGLLSPVKDAGQRNPQLQGPHVIADITLDHIVETRASLGTNQVLDLLGTGFAPPPTVVTQMMKAESQFPDLGKEFHLETHRDLTASHVNSYLEKYDKKFKKALTTTDHDDAKRRVRTLMNMQPTATYAWGKGRATHEELAGKGERDKMVWDDIKNVKAGQLKSLNTVDSGFENHFPSPLQNAVNRNIEDLGRLDHKDGPRKMFIHDIFKS